MGISEDDTYNVLILLNPHKATGIDCIGPKLLKNCVCFLYRPLNYLFNLTLHKQNGVYTVLFLYLNLVTEDKSPIIVLCNTSKVLDL